MSEYGQTTEVGICFQDSYGTSNVDSMHWIPFTSESVTLKKPPIISEELAGSFDEGPSYEGPNMVDGECTIDANPITLGVLLKALCGDPVTVNSGSIYTHTFNLRTADFDNQHAGDPFTYYKHMETGSAQLMSDLAANEFELSIANGELLSAKLGVVGGTFEQIASIAASYPEEDHFTWDASSMSFVSSAADQLSELTINVNQSLEAAHTLRTGKFPSRIKRTGWRSTTVSGTFRFEDQTEFQEFLAQSQRLFTVHFQDDTEIQSGYFNSLTLTMSAFRYEEHDIPAAGVGPIETSFTGKAKGRTAPIQFTLVNTQPGY